MKPSHRPSLWLSICITGACLLALADWPYGYYQLLRLGLTGYAVWIAWLAFEEDRTTWAWSFAMLAVLYNPLVKIPLDRDTWGVVNIATAALVAIELWNCSGRSTNENIGA